MLNINRPIACRLSVMSYLASGFVGRNTPAVQNTEDVQDENIYSIK
jgi:hypothetical protein